MSHALPSYVRLLQEIEIATRALGLQQRVMEIRDPGEFDNAFAAMTTAHLDAIFIPADSMFYQHRVRLAQLATKTRLPAIEGDARPGGCTACPRLARIARTAPGSSSDGSSQIQRNLIGRLMGL